jgi:hypothetical protein
MPRDHLLKNVDPVATQQYIEKADQFVQGMKLLNDDVLSYRTGIGLLAIHSAISLNDAITVGLTGKRKTYQDHTMAARELEKVCQAGSLTKRALTTSNGFWDGRMPWLMNIGDLTINPSAWLWTRRRNSALGLTLISRRFFVAYKPVLSPEQEHGRAQNAVADLLSRQLIVPKVFFEAHWPSRRSRVDVLAVDRSGSGEIHVAEVKRGRDLRAEDLIERLMEIPAHFKYVALFDNPKNHRPHSHMLYSSDGIGRIGIIEVREEPLGNLNARISVQPERFKLDSSVYKMVDRFTANYPANMEVRS